MKPQQSSPFNQFQEAVKDQLFNIEFPSNFKILIAGASGTYVA